MKINGIELGVDDAARMVREGQITGPLDFSGSTDEEMTAYYQTVNRLAAPRGEQEIREHAGKLQKLASLLRTTAGALVTDPEQVSVRVRMADGLYLFAITTKPEDVGRVVGKKFVMYHALKLVLQTAGQRVGLAVTMEIEGAPRTGGNDAEKNATRRGDRRSTRPPGPGGRRGAAQAKAGAPTRGEVPPGPAGPVVVGIVGGSGLPRPTGR